MQDFSIFLKDQINSELNLPKNCISELCKNILEDIGQRNISLSRHNRISIKFEHEYITGRNRKNGLDKFTYKISSNSKQIYSKPLIIKETHHIGERELSLKASKFGIGPKIYTSNKTIIIEEYFSYKCNWQSMVDENLFPPPDLFGKEIIDKYLLMLKNNVIHLFDALPEHLYIINTLTAPEIKFIDWGKRAYLSKNANEVTWRHANHFGVLIDILLNIETGVEVFRHILRYVDKLENDNNKKLIKTVLEKLIIEYTGEKKIKSYSISGEYFQRKRIEFFNKAMEPG